MLGTYIAHAPFGIVERASACEYEGVDRSRHLVLWDVDRTLVDIGSVSREIYARAFRMVTGQPLSVLADMTGRTEKAILTDTLALHGMSELEVEFEDFYEALSRAAEELRGRMRAEGRRLPGTAEALSAMASERFIQTVVTGNLRRIAVVKLAVFELAHHFDFDVGGYGSDDGLRAILVRLAWKRAEQKYGVQLRPGDLTVIGDTEHDIAAARAVGVRSVGVATGESTTKQLRGAGADVVLPNLSDTRAVVGAVMHRDLEI